MSPSEGESLTFLRDVDLVHGGENDGLGLGLGDIELIRLVINPLAARALRILPGGN